MGRQPKNKDEFASPKSLLKIQNNKTFQIYYKLHVGVRTCFTQRKNSFCLNF